MIITMKSSWFAFSRLAFIFLIIFFYGCKKEEAQNQAPVIESITINPTNPIPGTNVQVNAVVIDNEGEEINYNWVPEVGTVHDPNSQYTIWEIPASTPTNRSYYIDLAVTDGKNLTTGRESIRTKNGITVEGYVYFKHTIIPISGANIVIGNASSFSDESGYYLISNVVDGNQVITVTKSGFEEINQTESISYSNSDIDFYMFSEEHTRKVYGTVRAADELPVSGMKVTLLNPDGSPSEISVISNSAGEFELLNVPVGSRIIQVEDKNPDVRTYDDLVEYEINLGSSNINLNPTMLIRRTISLDVMNPDAWTYITPGLYEIQADKLFLHAGAELIIELPFSFPDEFKPADKDINGSKQIWFYYYFGEGNSTVGINWYADNESVDFDYWPNPYAEDYKLFKTYQWSKYRGSKAKFRFYTSNGGYIQSASFKCYY